MYFGLSPPGRRRTHVPPSASHTQDHAPGRARRRLPGLVWRPRGAATFRGDGGRDVLRGTAKADRLIGRAGHDRLFGGRGHDLLVGGAGRDVARGGRGNDRIRMRDGERDRVTCGRGRDRAVLDSADRILDARPANPNGQLRASHPAGRPSSPMRSWPPPETSPTASRAPRSPRACWTDCPGPWRCSVTRRTTTGRPTSSRAATSRPGDGTGLALGRRSGTTNTAPPARPAISRTSVPLRARPARAGTAMTSAPGTWWPSTPTALTSAGARPDPSRSAGCAPTWRQTPPSARSPTCTIRGSAQAACTAAARR